MSSVRKEPDPRQLELAREILLTQLLIVATLVAAVLASSDILSILVSRVRHLLFDSPVGPLTQGDFLAGVSHWRLASILEQFVFFGIAALLVYGGLVYQITRLGYLRRLLAHRRETDESLHRIYDRAAEPLAILVPSFREEAVVIRKTLLSAALQEYPERRVVLLIDDPSEPRRDDDRAALVAARALPAEVARLLAPMRERLDDERLRFEERERARPVDRSAEGARLSKLYDDIAEWMFAQAEAHPRLDHSDDTFVKLAWQDPAHAHRTTSWDLAERELETAEIARHYRRLATLFRVEIGSFERKRYENLSHEPNKAMNLNSYIALLGGTFREKRVKSKLWLLGVPDAPGAIRVPDATYLITLDADSLLAGDCALRFTAILERSENARMAVVQTPYSAFPGAANPLERMAGATTDIQFIIHQGFTAFDATYWVSANALIRKAALEDIVEVDEERGHSIRRYIQDRTVIEDTDSSVDLIDRGWKLYNYPERMAYRATPSDFGSLLVQRRRWANGGLVLLPKLLRYISRGTNRYLKLSEGLIRAHYHSSITAVNFGLLIVLAGPFERSIRSPWLLLAALPYYLLYFRDLLREGYRWRDLPGVYALNLLLIPVNLGGVMRSLVHAMAGMKPRFERAAKVTGRMVTPAFYVALEYALLANWIVSAGLDLARGKTYHALFAIVNAGLLAYGITRLIGWRDSFADLRLGLNGTRAGLRGEAAGRLQEPARQEPMIESLATRESDAEAA